ncbi:MAG TPA: NAD(P)/FAD-dependent oxidoreductase, partial [Gemmatimonadaceae bacterium]
HGIRSAEHLSRARFRGEHARALLGGTAAHAVVRLDRSPSAAFALVLLVAAHAVGWPFVRGGSQGLADALVSYLRTLGGTVVTDAPVRSLDELDTSDIAMLDLTPPQVLALAGHRLPAAYASALRRYRFGPGVFKVDWALSAPVPWTSTDARRSGVLHLGGRIDEIAVAEADVWEGRHPERPFVILAQPTTFDRGRAPPGSHTLWAYCHVPNGSAFDMTSRIENQIERFAPGFRDLVIGRHTMAPAAMEAHDANLIGGEIGGGENSLAQLFFRPVARRVPYATPLRGVYICSASTPPGGAIHGMGGYHAARAALRTLRLLPSPIGPEHRGEWA